MKRPLVIVAIGYIIGIVWGLYCSCSIALLYALIIICCLLIKIFSKPKSKFKLFSLKRYFRYIKIIFKFNVIFTIIISSLISNLIVIFQNNKYENLYSNIGEGVSLTGTIVSNKKEKDYKSVYKIKVETINGSKNYKNTYLLLNVKNNIKVELKYGNKVIVTGDLVKPDGQRNYKGFNYKNFLKTQKTYGTLKAKNVKILKDNNVNFIFKISNNTFLKIKQNVQNIFPKPINEVFLGVMLGYTDKIEEDIIQNFRDSNIAHVLAVSGMHISYIIIGLTTILSKAFGRRKSQIITIIILIIYMFITGFAPSVVRATIMGIILLGAGILYRRADTWTSIAISILVILIYNPFLLESLSVLLSYGGTIGIITFGKSVKNILNKFKIIEYIKNVLSITISAQIIIMPIMIMYFNTIGIAFCITNLLLSIIIGPIVVLGFFTLIISLISLNVLKICSYILSPMLQILIYIAKLGSILPVNKVYTSTPSIFTITIYYILVFIIDFIYKIYLVKKPNTFQFRIRNIVSLVKYKLKKQKNKFIPISLIICIIITSIQIIPNNLEIYFIDVGQGDSTLIITPQNKSILIDGGGSETSSFDVGKNTLLPYLLARHVTHVDYMIISHFDSDHVRWFVICNARNKSEKCYYWKTI